MGDNGSHVRLVADIGGTNARFALLNECGMPAQVQVFACADYPDVESAIRAYMASARCSRLAEAAIAIANPVTGDAVAMTNHHWSFSISTLKNNLALEHLSVVNDFAALAMALPFLPRTELVQLGGGSAEPGEPVGVIGPGTGLGVAGLVPCGVSWKPLPGEGGHATLAAANDVEAEVIALLRRQWGHVSAERIISGPGLALLREAIGVLRNEPAERLSPAEITQRAITGEDDLSRESLNMFCAMLGTIAGNLALTLGTRGGVYLGGGILPRLGSFFLESPFRARFEQKGRFAGYLAAIPCYVIHSEQPALIGASRFLPHRAS